MATTPYAQPAPQDWSALSPATFGNPLAEINVAAATPAARAVFGPQGRALQPWAAGQQVPAGLLNYQIPGGTLAEVTYSNPNLGLFDFNQQQNNQQLNNQNFNYTHPAMNPSMPQMNAWLSANPMTDGSFSTALDWNRSLPKLNLFGNTFDYSTYGGGDELNALDILAEAEK